MTGLTGSHGGPPGCRLSWKEGLQQSDNEPNRSRVTCVLITRDWQTECKRMRCRDVCMDICDMFLFATRFSCARDRDVHTARVTCEAVESRCSLTSKAIDTQHARDTRKNSTIIIYYIYILKMTPSARTGYTPARTGWLSPNLLSPSPSPAFSLLFL